MNAAITVGSNALVIMILSISPFILNQAEGQISFPCPDGYQRNTLGLCEPLANSGPNLQRCPEGYIRSLSGVCELVGGPSPPLNNATNQTQNQGSSLAQQQPNTGGATPLQQPLP
jgi:hypothetical protein